MLQTILQTSYYKSDNTIIRCVQILVMCCCKIKSMQLMYKTITVSETTNSFSRGYLKNKIKTNKQNVLNGNCRVQNYTMKSDLIFCRFKFFFCMRTQFP